MSLPLKCCCGGRHHPQHPLVCLLCEASKIHGCYYKQDGCELTRASERALLCGSSCPDAATLSLFREQHSEAATFLSFLRSSCRLDIQLGTLILAVFPFRRVLLLLLFERNGVGGGGRRLVHGQPQKPFKIVNSCFPAITS